MGIRVRSITLIAAGSVATASFGQTILDPVQGLLAGTPDVSNATYSWVALTGYRATLNAKNSYFVVRLPQFTSFVGRSHVDLRLKNNAGRPAIIEADVSSNNGAGWMSSTIVLGPYEQLDVTMPLYEAEQYGLRALPTPTDTTRPQSRSLGNLFANDVRGVYFFNKDTLAADVTFGYLATANHTVPLTSIVDTYGQQRLISWQGKVTADQQLRDAIAKDPDGVYPYQADSFGGVAAGKNYGAAERFRLVKDGRWYLVTPSGNRFFSFGVNEVGAMAWTQVTGRENMFTDLPNLQANFPSAFTYRGSNLGVGPYNINLQRKYGATWKTQAYDIFPKRLRSWGFNTVGVNSWDALQSQRQMPSTFGISLWSPHPHLMVGSRSISDPYDPAFVTAAKSDIGRRLTEVSVNHPYSIGVFVDNELPWGDGKSTDANKRYAIARGALNAPASASAAKLLATLKAKYSTIAALNVSWGSSYAGWSDLQSGSLKFPPTITPAMDTDLKGFGRRFAETYFSTIRSAITASGYKGLYLGCRFTRIDYTPEALAAAKLYADVLSFNIYQGFPSRSNPDLKSLDFPVLISEFCFGANDRGRVGMPLYPTMSEKSRVDAYKRFIADIKTWPNLVGVHWYRWDDFPTTAKTDHDNMQEGLVSITDMFYSELHAQTRASALDYMTMLQQAP